MRASTAYWTSLGVAWLANNALNVMATDHADADSGVHSTTATTVGDNSTLVTDFNSSWIATEAATNTTGNGTDIPDWLLDLLNNNDDDDGGGGDTWFSFSNAGFRNTFNAVVGIAIAIGVGGLRVYCKRRYARRAAATNSAQLTVTTNGEVIAPCTSRDNSASIQQQPTSPSSTDNAAFSASTNNVISNYARGAPAGQANGTAAVSGFLHSPSVGPGQTDSSASVSAFAHQPSSLSFNNSAFSNCNSYSTAADYSSFGKY